jgi:L-lysine 2,3-aminomutase
MQINLSPHAAWQQALANVITSPKELLTLLNLDVSLLPKAEKAAELFPLRVPRGYAARMRKNDLNCPLLKQVLPLEAELQKIDGYTKDPLNEKNVNPLPGLLHKYAGRVLLTVTNACAIHCRYCFRRDFPYADNSPNTKEWDKVIDYIANDFSLREVILSGGDPLAVNDKYLEKLIKKIVAISHIKTLRIHTRLPIVLPERITSELIQILSHSQKRIVIVVHSNHANEIDETVSVALQKLRTANIVLLNQTVLLRGINDSAETQIELIETLFDEGILPYYLHLPDKVQSTAHFDVAELDAQMIMSTLLEKLPGYLVPRLVREIPGEKSKTLTGL